MWNTLTRRTWVVYPNRCSRTLLETSKRRVAPRSICYRNFRLAELRDKAGRRVNRSTTAHTATAAHAGDNRQGTRPVALPDQDQQRSPTCRHNTAYHHPPHTSSVVHPSVLTASSHPDPQSTIPDLPLRLPTNRAAREGHEVPDSVPSRPCSLFLRPHPSPTSPSLPQRRWGEVVSLPSTHQIYSRPLTNNGACSHAGTVPAHFLFVS